jgi:hypothetical protein
VRDGADTSVGECRLVHAHDGSPREVDNGSEDEGVDAPVDEVEQTGGGSGSTEKKGFGGLKGGEFGKRTVAGEALTLGESLSRCSRFRVRRRREGSEVQRVAVSSLLFLLLERTIRGGRSGTGRRRVNMRVLVVDGGTGGGRALLEDVGEGGTLRRLFGNEGGFGRSGRTGGDAGCDDVVGDGVCNEEERDQVRTADEER